MSFLSIIDPYLPLVPTSLLLLAALIILCLPDRPRLAAWITSLSAAGGLFISLIIHRGGDHSYFAQMLAWNAKVALPQSFILLALLLSVLVGRPLARQAARYGSEFYALLLFATVGAVQMTMCRNLLALFLALELMSLPLYVLCAFRKHDARSREAGFKYFMLGAFAAGLFLMGSAYLYGASGSLQFADLAAQHDSPLYYLGSAFLLAALGFKAALFPFQSWLPDVYEGAPAPVTGFMASAVKMAVFGTLVVLVSEAGLFSSAVWQLPLKVFIILSMTLANLAALKQKSLKRMLAYSSIAHVAYMMIALVAVSTPASADFAWRAVLFYVVIYGIASLGTFALLTALDEREDAPFFFDRLQGLNQSRPGVALCLALLLVSLAGIPPLAGFIGKFYLFSAALQAGHLDLAIAAIINSLISVYYYARPVVLMYMQAPSESTCSLRPAGMFPVLLVAACTLVLTLLFGVLPAILFAWTGSF